jgi:hypothetical protein
MQPTFRRNIASIFRVEENFRKKLLATCLLAENFFDPEDRGDVPPKRRLHLNRLHGVTSQKMILFITPAVKTSNPTYYSIYL